MEHAVPPTEGTGGGGDLDLLALPELLARLHGAYAVVGPAVEAALPALEQAVAALVERWPVGGRLILVGAGTSGRLALAEAAECPPTFGTAPERVVAVLAGGPSALVRAAEGAEDDTRAGRQAVAALGPGPADVVIGVSASGSAAFVCAGLAEARALGAFTAALTSAPASPICAAAAWAIVLPTGAEPIAGSTRMVAGSAQKMALNLLTTAAMARLGHVHGNRMIDFRPTNAKLRARAVRLVADLAGVDAAGARAALEGAGWSVKAAAVVAALAVDPAEARVRLERAGGSLRRALAGPPPPQPR